MPFIILLVFLLFSSLSEAQWRQSRPYCERVAHERALQYNSHAPKGERNAWANVQATAREIQNEFRCFGGQLALSEIEGLRRVYSGDLAHIAGADETILNINSRVVGSAATIFAPVIGRIRAENLRHAQELSRWPLAADVAAQVRQRRARVNSVTAAISSAVSEVPAQRRRNEIVSNLQNRADAMRIQILRQAGIELDEIDRRIPARSDAQIEIALGRALFQAILSACFINAPQPEVVDPSFGPSCQAFRSELDRAIARRSGATLYPRAGDPGWEFQSVVWDFYRYSASRLELLSNLTRMISVNIYQEGRGYDGLGAIGVETRSANFWRSQNEANQLYLVVNHPDQHLDEYVLEQRRIENERHQRNLTGLEHQRVLARTMEPMVQVSVGSFRSRILLSEFIHAPMPPLISKIMLATTDSRNQLPTAFQNRRRYIELGLSQEHCSPIPAAELDAMTDRDIGQLAPDDADPTRVHDSFYPGTVHQTELPGAPGN